MRNTTSILFLATIIVIALPSASPFSLQDLSGNWDLSMGFAAEANLGFDSIWNPVFSFTPYNDNQNVALETVVIDSIQYQQIHSHFNYSVTTVSDSILNLTLTVSPYTVFQVQFFDNSNVIMSNIDGASNPQYTVYGLVKPPQSANNIYEFINQTFPDLPVSVANWAPLVTTVPSVANFDINNLLGHVWYCTAYWSLDSENDDEAEMAEEKMDQGVVIDTINEALFMANKTNYIEGHFSENVLWYYFGTDLVGGTIQQLLPYMDNKALLLGSAFTWVVNYYDGTNLVIIEAQKNYARHFSTNPFYNVVNFGIFEKQMVAAGINPLQGKTYQYNNSKSSPSEFGVEMLFHDHWAVIAAFDNLTENSGIWRQQVCLNYTFSPGDGSSINVHFQGQDLNTYQLIDQTGTWYYNPQNERYLYPDQQMQDTPFYITILQPYLFIMGKQVGDKVEALLVANYAFFPFFGFFEQYALNAYFPDARLLTFSDLFCRSYVDTVDDWTDDQVVGAWWVEAFFGIDNDQVHCWSASFTKNGTMANYYDIEMSSRDAYGQYVTRVTSAPSIEQRGIFIPYAPDFFYAYEGKNGFFDYLTLDINYLENGKMILMIGPTAAYFLSRNNEFTSADQATFIQQTTQEKVYGSLFTINNANCGSAEEEFMSRIEM